MKEKNMLSETQVRRFMKLAGNDVLSESFVGSQVEDKQLDEIELEEEGLYKDDEELEAPLDDAAPEAADVVDDAPLDDAPVDDELGVDSGPMSKVADIVQGAVMDALSGAVEAGELDISADEDAAPDAVAPVDEPVDAPVDELEPAPALEEATDEDALEEAEVTVVDEENIANEVLKRVAARLVKENKREKLLDELAERLKNSK